MLLPLSAVPDDLAVVEGLHDAAVALTVGKGRVATEEGVDGVELLLSDAQRVLHDEPLNILSAGRGGEGALVVIMLATESLAELVEVHRGVDGDTSERGLGSIGPVNGVEERVGETALGLDVEENSDNEEIVEASGALLLVDDVEFHLLVAILGRGGVEGVLRGSVELELLDVVLLAVARVAAANGHIAEITLDLESIARVLESEVGNGDVVVVNAVLLGVVLAVTNADSGLGVNVDGRLLGARRASASPVAAALGVGPGGWGRSISTTLSGLESTLLLLGSSHSQYESKRNDDTHFRR